MIVFRRLNRHLNSYNTQVPGNTHKLTHIRPTTGRLFGVVYGGYLQKPLSSGVLSSFDFLLFRMMIVSLFIRR